MLVETLVARLAFAAVPAGHVNAPRVLMALVNAETAFVDINVATGAHVTSPTRARPRSHASSAVDARSVANRFATESISAVSGEALAPVTAFRVDA